MQSNLLPVADAIAARLVEVITPTFPAAEVLVTWFDERFDAKTTTGFKVFVTPLSDVPGAYADGGTRLSQPLRYTYAVTFVERMPSTVQGPDAKDLWTRQRIEVVGQCREALDNALGFELPGLDLPLCPVDSDEREAADMELLRRLGLFHSHFGITLREDS